MNGTLYLKVSGYAGSSIDRTCPDLCKLAWRMGINIHCDFNGVTIIARPDSDSAKLSEAWAESIRSGHVHKVATT